MPGRGRLAVFSAIALLALCAALPAATAAANPDAPAFAQRIDSSLAALAAGASSLDRAEREQGIEVVGSRAVVLVLTDPARTGAAQAAVGRAGGIVDVATPGSIEAEVAPAQLLELSAATAVRYVEPIRPDQPQAVAGQEIAKSGAGLAQIAGTTGAGVKVAVIDNGFAGLAAGQAAGDIPAGAITQNFCSGPFDGTAHGTGVAEIVAEMAPDAQLYLICAGTFLELAQAEQYAVAQGVSVVNRSESNFNPAVRGDGSGGPGTEDATVEDARNNGILWVNSAGNYARIHWGGPYTDANTNQFLDFVPGDESNNLSLANNRQICLNMKWDAWPVTNQNFDLQLLDGATDVFGLQGKNVQSGTQPPAESGCYTNSTGATQSLAIKVVNTGGGIPGTRIDLFVSNEGVGVIQHPVAEGSVTEPATAPEALAVGAVCPVNDGLQSYSSNGPTVDGRIKPDISGFAPVDSTAYGTVTGTGCTGGFSGTSAASPNVAGAAALYKQANPGAGPAQLQAILEGTATDLGPPGKDNQFGAGELQLRPAQPDLLIKGKKKAVGDGIYSGHETARRKVSAGGRASFTATLQNDGVLPATFLLKGGKSHKGVHTTYLVRGHNQTNHVVKPGLELALSPGAAQKITIKMRTKPGTHGGRAVSLRASNDVLGSLRDKVTAKLKIR